MASFREDYRLLAVVSGALASASGLAGKLGLGDVFNEPNESQGFLETLWRLMWLCLTLALNSIMLTIYTKSLSLAKNAAVASVLNTAANMVITAFFSILIFGEKLSCQWLTGAFLILLGVSLLLVQDDKIKNS